MTAVAMPSSIEDEVQEIYPLNKSSGLWTFEGYQEMEPETRGEEIPALTKRHGDWEEN